jgi:serine/threonine-protein kinase
MMQILLAILGQFWLPVTWSILSFVVTTSILYLGVQLPRIKNFLFPDPVCHIGSVKHFIQQSDYNTAVLVLKNCSLSDELFELAYELGLLLEQEKNWSTARTLYAWLVQFDPGMNDFVERIDSIMNQTMDQDLSLTEISDSKNQFGHFQLLGKKARGATATVYEAHDLNTHQHIALKILNQHLNDESGERDIMTFLHEALTVSHLDHPGIVKIHDADIIDDRAYIAMDYIAGYPMSERLRRKKLLTAAESLRIMRCVLDALVLAHHEGIVHGDIKPANIMYDKFQKNYIITDFGAAYSSKRDHDGEKKIIGTPAYMSPEQLTGARLDGRSDLFSLAVTIYHLLSGVQPFSGESLPEMKRSILEDEVDIERLTVPYSIKQVLQKALQKKPYQRFADASQMLYSVNHCEDKLIQNK